MVFTLSHALIGLLASVALLVSPAPAQEAPPAEGPVAECLQAMATVTMRTTKEVRQTVRRTTAVIENLDADGATDKALAKAAREGRDRVGESVGQGVRRVNTIAARCIRALRENDAPAEAIAAVEAGRDRALGAITESGRHGAEAIRASLEAALAD